MPEWLALRERSGCPERTHRAPSADPSLPAIFAPIGNPFTSIVLRSGFATYTAEDIWFTTRGRILFAGALAWPANRQLNIRTLAAGSAQYPAEIARVELVGASGSLKFSRDARGTAVTLPAERPNEYTPVLKITPAR